MDRPWALWVCLRIKNRGQKRWTLKHKLSWRELQALRARASCQRLITQPGWRNGSGPLLGFRGQKRIIRSDFCKIEQRLSSCEHRDVTAAPPTPRVLAVFWESQNLSKRSLTKEPDGFWPNTRLKTTTRTGNLVQRSGFLLFVCIFGTFNLHLLYFIHVSIRYSGADCSQNW